MCISSNIRRGRWSRCLAAALLLAWLAGWSVAGHGAGDGRTAADVRFVVDVSARMGAADPDNVRGRALAMLLRSLPDDGKAGVWTYGKYVNMLVKYGASDGLWKETATIHTANLASVGQRGDLLEAVERASWDRGAGQGPAHLVLLSDGHLDIADDPAANAAARQRLLTTLAPELAAAGYRVHTLSFGESADTVLLESLADATGGRYARLESAAALPEGLLDLLGWVAGTASVEVDALGSFRVAPGTRELTVLKTGGASGAVRLVSPAGERLGPETPRQRVRWHLDPHYELVSLDRPEPGTWRFEGETRGLRVYAYGDLGLRYPDLPATLFPAALRTFDLVLSSDAGPVQDRAFLDLLEVTARLQGEEQSRPVVVEAHGDGRYAVNLQNLRGEGDYVLETRLQAPTFTHRLSLPLALVNPVSVEVHPAEAGFRLWAQVRAHELDHDSLRMAALIRRPPAAAELIPVEKLPAGLWRADVPGTRGLLEVTFDLKGNYRNGKDFHLKTEPIRVVLPVTAVQYVRMDLRGRPVLAAQPTAGEMPVTEAPPPPAVPEPPPPETSATPAPPPLEVPIWFVLLVAAVNGGLMLALWWVLGTRGRFPELRPKMERLRKLAELYPPAAPGLSP